MSTQPWESGGDPPWEPEDSDEDDEVWRGEEQQDDWPEGLAGPEYWLYKRDRDAQD